MTSDYRFSPRLAARLLGVTLVALGVLVLVITAVLGALGLPGSFLLVVFAVAVFLVAAAGWWVTRKAYVVRFSDVGYRVRFVRGVGVSRGRWKDVEDAVTTTVAESPVVMIRLRDGGSTTIPVEMLAINREVFVTELQQHLQRGQGLRPL